MKKISNETYCLFKICLFVYISSNPFHLFPNLLRNAQIQTPITPSLNHQQLGVIPRLLPLVLIFTWEKNIVINPLEKGILNVLDQI